MSTLLSDVNISSHFTESFSIQQKQNIENIKSAFNTLNDTDVFPELGKSNKINRTTKRISELFDLLSSPKDFSESLFDELVRLLEELNYFIASITNVFRKSHLDSESANYQESFDKVYLIQDRLKFIFNSQNELITTWKNNLPSEIHGVNEVTDAYSNLITSFKKFKNNSNKMHSNEERISILTAKVKDLQTLIYEQVETSVSSIENNISNKINSAVKNSTNIFDDELSRSKTLINNELSAFEDLNKELKSQAAARGNETLAMGNTAQANKEKVTADRLRIIGTSWLIVLSGYSAWIFHEVLSNPNNLNLGVMLIRWLVIFLLTLPGIYLLRESSRHRADERKYRKLGVQLATINSYLHGFSEDEKKAIKQQLTANFFSSEDVKSDDSTVPDLMKSFEKTLDAVITIAKKK